MCLKIFYSLIFRSLSDLSSEKWISLNEGIRSPILKFSHQHTREKPYPLLSPLHFPTSSCSYPPSLHFTRIFCSPPPCIRIFSFTSMSGMLDPRNELMAISKEEILALNILPSLLTSTFVLLRSFSIFSSLSISLFPPLPSFYDFYRHG